jgi:hypothetical protein
MDLSEAHKRWYNYQEIKGVLYKYNDYVHIKSGEHEGKFAKQVSKSFTT